MKTFGALVLSLVLAAPAAAQEVKAGDLTLSGLQLRSVAPGAPTTAGYLTIANAGDRADKLVSVSCACAARVEVHLSHVMDGVAMMMPAGEVEIPAHGSVTFKPGGYHLMVIGPKAPLKDGAMQDVVLKFRRAGTVTAAFHVKARIDAAAER